MSKPEQPTRAEETTSSPRFTLAQLMEINLNNRDNGLGDRSLYFGASEILSCEEAMWHAKIRNVKKERTLKELIVLLKGNVGEILVEMGLGEAEVEPQVECKGTGEYSFIKAHADFVVKINSKGEKIVIEVKTTGDIPDTIRESWYAQTQVQMGLLGIKRAKLFAMNLNSGHYKEFDIIFNQVVFESTLKTMKEKWDRIHQVDYEPKGTCSALCAFCPFKLECNTLKTEKTLPDDIAHMAKRYKDLKKEMSIIEGNLKAFMDMANFNRAKNEKHNVIVDVQKRSGYERIDLVKLKFEYPETYRAVACKQEKTDVMNIY